jgi:hypothetical protein
MRCLFTAFCLYGVAAQAAAAEQQAEKGIDTQVERVISTQVSDKGIVLSVALPEKVYAGAEISLVVSVKNQGETDVVYYDSGKYHDCHVEVVDSTGKAVPPTRFGKIALGRNQQDFFKRVTKILRFHTGFKETLNLARAFDLTMAGDYAVTVSRVFNENSAGAPVKLTVSKFAFRVLEPSK